MEILWKNNTDRIKAVYWSNRITLKDINDQIELCDYLQIWYPHECDDNIFDTYGMILSYIEYEGKWKGKAYSSIIDLTQSKEILFNSITKNRRYEIRRAKERDNLYIVFIDNISEKDFLQFIHFYHQFAMTKKGLAIDIDKVKALAEENKFVIAKVIDSNGETVVMHGYIADEEDGIAALFSSSSLYRIDKENANLIGRANAFLHYASMLYFKEKRYKYYDLGGAYQGKENIQLMNITKFKESFGGKVVEFCNGFVIPMKEVRSINKCLEQNKEKFFRNKVIVWGAGMFGKYVLKQLTERMGITIERVIDNKLAKSSDKYCAEGILDIYDPERTAVIVTTNEECFESIAKQENCKKYIQNGMLIGVRESGY